MPSYDIHILSLIAICATIITCIFALIGYYNPTERTTFLFISGTFAMTKLIVNTIIHCLWPTVLNGIVVVLIFALTISLFVGAVLAKKIKS